MSVKPSACRSQRGFTLLELLLVLAIMASLTVAGLGWYRHRVAQAKVVKTGLQMQQLLQAGMAYYVDHRVWPSSVSKLQDYLPQLHVNNPWGNDASSPYHYQIISEPNARYLQLKTWLPTTGVINGQAMAQQIAARLPYAKAEIDSSGNASVISSVTLPGQAIQDHNRPLITQVATVPSLTQVNKPTDCPAHMHPQLNVAMAGFTVPMSMTGTPARIHEVSTGISAADESQWQAQLDVQGIRSELQDNRMGKILVVSSCVPDAVTVDAEQNARTDFFIY